MRTAKQVEKKCREKERKNCIWYTHTWRRTKRRESWKNCRDQSGMDGHSFLPPSNSWPKFLFLCLSLSLCSHHSLLFLFSLSFSISVFLSLLHNILWKISAKFPFVCFPETFLSFSILSFFLSPSSFRSFFLFLPFFFFLSPSLRNLQKWKYFSLASFLSSSRERGLLKVALWLQFLPPCHLIQDEKKKSFSFFRPYFDSLFSYLRLLSEHFSEFFRLLEIPNKVQKKDFTRKEETERKAAVTSTQRMKETWRKTETTTAFMSRLLSYSLLSHSLLLSYSRLGLIFHLRLIFHLGLIFHRGSYSTLAIHLDSRSTIDERVEWIFTLHHVWSHNIFNSIDH